MKTRSGTFLSRPCNRSLLAAACALLGTLAVASAQTPGSLDPTFNAGEGPDARVRSLAVQSDGKVLVGGEFDTIDGTAHEGIARLNADGGLDAAFNPGTGVDFNESNSGVYAIAIQPDGKVLIAGVFEHVNGAAHNNIARLNTDGSIDASFAGMTGPDDDIRTMALQPDGKIIIGGGFAMVDGVARQNIARLDTNGALDTGFNANGKVGVEGEFVAALVVQPDGKIVAAGHFSSENSAPFDDVVRLNADGSVDASFNPGSGADNTIYAMARQTDGKLVVGGLFQSVDDAPRYGLARLNADGSLDNTFVPDLGTQDFATNALAIQADGKILFGGQSANEGPQGIARLNADGSLDATYNTGSGVGGTIFALQLQSDNNLVVGGNIGTVDGADSPNIFRLVGGSAHPAFFTGETALGNGVYYLSFLNGNYFGYYSYLTDPHYLYHFDLGYEYAFDADDGHNGVYLYDFESNGFFYTSPAFSFPYLYDFSLNSVVYYYPDPSSAGHYNTNGYRFFYVFNTGMIIVK